MMQIFLKDLKLSGEHGVSEAEKYWNTTFVVNVVLDIEERINYLELDHTIDYQQAYHLIKTEFSIRERLLENLVNRIYMRLVESFPTLSQVEISIAKIDPPIKNFSGRVGVTLKKSVSR
jgi:dihydroneopterin aldolase